jgi:hypothetical protein
MGSRRDIVALVAVLFVLVAIAVAVRPSGDGAGDDPRVSSFLTGPHGAAALYMLMDELEIPAGRLLQAWSADSSPAALVVLAPSQPATPREGQVLRTWIEQGGTLIYGAGGSGGLEALLGLQLQRTLPDTLGPLATVRWSGVGAFPEPHAWTAGIDSVAGFMSTFRATSRALQEPSAEVLMRTRNGEATVISFPVEAGRVIAWSDASVLGNRALRTSDAALLFARSAAAAVAEAGELRFDEYHHGYREANPLRALGAVLTRTGGGRALLQGVVACLALLLLAGSRFGAPVEEHTERRRSPLEHMQALAGAYERSGARSAARRLLLAGLERQLGRRVLSDSAALPPAALDGTAAGRRLKVEWERGAEGDLTELAGAVDEFVREVRRWK